MKNVTLNSIYEKKNPNLRSPRISDFEEESKEMKNDDLQICLKNED